MTLNDDGYIGDRQHNISESADKLRLKTKLTRGTDTRDQEAIEVVVKGDDPEKTVAKLNSTLSNLRETVGMARRMQAGDADE